MTCHMPKNQVRELIKGALINVDGFLNVWSIFEDDTLIKHTNLLTYQEFS
jgi:hypothetical protein